MNTNVYRTTVLALHEAGGTGMDTLAMPTVLVEPYLNLGRSLGSYPEAIEALCRLRSAMDAHHHYNQGAGQILQTYSRKTQPTEIMLY